MNQLEKEGVIQRFEYGFELAWKTIKDYLEGSGFVFAIITPRQVLKDAFTAKVIVDGQVWIDMLGHRNLLAHTYNEATFDETIAAIQQRYLVALEDLHTFLQREYLK